MKFILSFFLYIIFLSPVFATVTDSSTCNNIDTSNTCKSTNGCGDWDDDFGCSQCQSGTYNNGSTQSCQSCENDSNYQAIVSDPLKRHPAGASSCSDFICESGYIQSGNDCILNCTLTDGYYLPAGATSCNDWQCDIGWYRNQNRTACVQCPSGTTTTGYDSADISQCQCQSKSNDNNAMSLLLIQITGNQYYCGWCGDGIITTANTNPVQCTCYHGANIVNGEQTVANNIPVQCVCPSGTANIDTTTNTCQCGADHYLKSNNGTWTCAQCPSHSHHSTIGSEDVNDCVCDEDHPTRIFDDNNKLIECGQCPDSNSTYDSATNKCKCIKGYYDTTPEANTVSCAPCPAGATTNGIGAQSKTACTMNSSTQFCDSRGQNCMNLIPNGVEISASAN